MTSTPRIPRIDRSLDDSSTPLSDMDDSIMDSDISTMMDPLGCSNLDSDTGSSDTDSPADTDIYIDDDVTPPDESSAEYSDLEQFSNVLALPYVPRRDQNTSPPGQSLEKKALDDTSILTSITASCLCPRACLDLIEFDQCHRLREIFWTKTRESKSQWLITKLENSQKSGKWTYIFLDNGQGVCLKSFQLIMNINKNYVTKHRALVEKGSVSKVSLVRQIDSRTSKYVHWLEEYSSIYADRMPNSKQVILPFNTLKKAVYKSYSTEVENHVLRTRFYSIWKQHFPQLRIKKTNGFAQCMKCASLQNQLETTTCPVKKNDIRKERVLHNQRQMLERKYYYGKKAASKQEPDEFLSLIIDGMDQSKTDLPHFTGRPSKAINPAVLMGTHVTGVMSHGHNLFLNYVDILEYPHDPNLTINIIIQALHHIYGTQERLPPVLYIQADNCYRENKNRYVLGFLELLVRQRIFQEVHISFLYSGHTHEDIDAGFSRISRNLNKNNAETLPDLLHLLPNVHLIQGILDVKSVLEGSLCKIKLISTPLHYKISSHGKAIKVHYKGQQHMPWICLDGRGSFLGDTPQGQPKILAPNFLKFDDNVNNLRKQIVSIKNMFTDEAKYLWWIDYLDNQKYKYKTRRINTKWISTLPRQPIKPKAKKSLNVLDPDLEKKLTKETAIPQGSPAALSQHHGSY